MDPHRNIFYFYRAPVKEMDGFPLDVQLENNTTKALYNLLEHSDKNRVLRPFIKHFLKLTPPADIDTVQFALQRRDIDRPDIDKRVLLTICGEHGDEAQQISKGTKRAGLPDGWIWCKDWVVLNENKLSQKISDAQLHRHMKGAEGWWAAKRPTRYRRTIRTWNEVHDFFSKLKGLDKESRSRFLVNQFTKYLEWIGMTKTWKLKDVDFAFFTTPEEERDAAYKKLVSSKLKTLMEELEQTRAIRRLKKRYLVAQRERSEFTYFGRAKRRADAFWFSFRPEYSQEYTHFSFYLTEAGMVVELFSLSKSSTKFALRKIRESKSQFLHMMKHLGKGRRGRNDQWFVQETPYSDPDSAYKGKKTDSGRPVLSVHPGFLREEIVDQALIVAQNLLRNRGVRPEFKLCREFNRSDMLTDGDIRRELEQTVSDFLPYLDFFSRHPRRVARPG